VVHGGLVVTRLVSGIEPVEISSGHPLRRWFTALGAAKRSRIGGVQLFDPVIELDPLIEPVEISPGVACAGGSRRSP
jgi:hypothetical protein